MFFNINTLFILSGDCSSSLPLPPSALEDAWELFLWYSCWFWNAPPFKSIFYTLVLPLLADKDPLALPAPYCLSYLALKATCYLEKSALAYSIFKDEVCWTLLLPENLVNGEDIGPVAKFLAWKCWCCWWYVCNGLISLFIMVLPTRALAG